MKNSNISRSLLLCILLLTTQQICALNFYNWIFKSIPSFHLTAQLKKHPLYSVIILASLTTFGIIIAKNQLFKKKPDNNKQTPEETSTNTINTETDINVEMKDHSDIPSDSEKHNNDNDQLFDKDQNNQNTVETTLEIISETQIIIPIQNFETIEEQPTQTLIKNNEPFKTADLIQLPITDNSIEVNDRSDITNDSEKHNNDNDQLFDKDQNNQNTVETTLEIISETQIIIPIQNFETIEEQPTQTLIKNNEPFKTADLIKLPTDVLKIILCYYLNFPNTNLIENAKTTKDIKKILLTLKRLVNMYLFLDSTREAADILTHSFTGIKFFCYPEDNQNQYWNTVKPGIERFIRENQEDNLIGYRVAIKVDPKNTTVYNKFFNHNQHLSKHACTKNYKKSKALLCDVIENKKMVNTLSTMSCTIKTLSESMKKNLKENENLKQQLQTTSDENIRLTKQINNTVYNPHSSSYSSYGPSYYPRSTPLYNLGNSIPIHYNSNTFRRPKYAWEKKPTENIVWGQDPYTSKPIKPNKKFCSPKYHYMSELPVNGADISPERFITD